MDNILNKIFRKYLVEHARKLITESDFDELRINMPYNVYSNIQSQKPVTFDVIPKTQYHHALKEFMQYGKFMRFPSKYIHSWKELALDNIALLNSLTEISGHSQHWPVDEFNDVFDNDGSFTKWVKKMNKLEGKKEYKLNDWGTHSKYLEDVYHIDKYLPLFSNGQWLLSDYGLDPLLNLAYELDGQDDPNEIIVTLNKIMDVAHQRSDLAELFIEGGTPSLDYISNS